MAVGGIIVYSNPMAYLLGIMIVFSGFIGYYLTQGAQGFWLAVYVVFGIIGILLSYDLIRYDRRAKERAELYRRHTPHRNHLPDDTMQPVTVEVAKDYQLEDSKKR